MEINKPIFIIGTGGCGSTVFHKMYTHHPNIAWFSWALDRNPSHVRLNKLFYSLISVPGFFRVFQKYKVQTECFNFWEYHCKGFRRPFRDLTAKDVTNNRKKSVHKAFVSLLTKKRNRLLIKITGWPRIGFLNEIFPDAKFIHIIRDGRGVVNSFLNSDFWWGWRGPSNWRWGSLSNEDMRIWEAHRKSFVALGAIQWRILMEAVEKAKKMISPSQYLEIKYENLCVEPIHTFRKVLEFSELPWTKRFKKMIGSYLLRDSNYKWKLDLTQEQQETLQMILAESLEKYRY